MAKAKQGTPKKHPKPLAGGGGAKRPHAPSKPPAKSIDVKPQSKNSREKHAVKDGGAEIKAAKSVTSAKGADAKAAKKDGKKGVATKVAAAVAVSKLRGAAAKSAAAKAAKKAEPPPPPRKIQVVQLTTLKPGARGTKASVARSGATIEDGRLPEAIAKKRRSAELTKLQLDHFRDLLQQRRSRLNSDLSLMQDEALKVTAQDNSSDSVADTGTDNYEQDFTLGLIESEEALAREVDQALVRIEQGTFGVCEACQTPVPIARLEILPFARYCVACQQKREGQS